MRFLASNTSSLIVEEGSSLHQEEASNLSISDRIECEPLEQRCWEANLLNEWINISQYGIFRLPSGNLWSLVRNMNLKCSISP